MRLLALRLRHFRRFEEAEYRFDPGLNLLIGPNEAGKSTLRQAILAAFFVNPATTAKKIAEWRPWGSDRLGSIALEFELDGRRFELRKDFEHRGLELRDLLHGVSYEPTKVQERLQAALGLSTEPLYRSTAMIEQTELTVLRAGAADIGQRLSRIIQAGPGDAEAGAVIKRFDKELADLEKGLDGRPVKTAGLIRGLQEEVAALTRERDALRRRVEVLESHREELRRIRIEADQAATELADREALFRENERLLRTQRELEHHRWEAQQLSEKVSAVDAGYERLAAIARAMEELQASGVPDDAAVARMHAAAGRLQQQEKTSDELARKVRAAEEGVRALADSPGNAGGRSRAPVAGWLLVALAVLVAAAAFGWSLLFLWPVAVAAGAVGVLVIVRAARQRWHADEAARARDGALLRLEGAGQDLLAAGEELTAARTILHRSVIAAGSGTMEDALERHSRMRQLETERTAAENQVAAHLGGREVEEVREARDRKRADVAGHEIQLRDGEAKRLTGLEVTQLERTVRELTQRVHTLAGRREYLERETAQGAPDDEALAAVEERLAERQEGLEIARRRDRVLRLAVEGLREARQQTLIPARQRVEERAGEYLTLLTGRAYDRVRITEPPLKVEVWAEGAGQWVEPAEPLLSRGTADQVYLAVRLALVEVLSEGRHPPLLLDDPFGSFDPERLSAAMALLRRVSESYQVLLFTCRPEYEPFADRVIPIDAAAPPAPELPGPLWQPPPQTH
jgi:DNA repair exonuclease SbcCD ATPase subunit